MRIIFGIFFLLFTLASAGADPLSEATSVRFALENNRDLRAARLGVEAAEARLRGAGRLSNPELEVIVAGGQNFEGNIEVGLMQRFPLTARLRLEKELSQLEVEAARQEVADQERRLAAQVRENFLELATARDTRALRDRQTETASNISTSLQRQAGEGFVSSLDVTQAALETAQLQVSADEAKAVEAASAGEFATLLGLPITRSVVLRGGLELPSSLPDARSSPGRPDLALARIAITAAETDLALARAMRWEDIGLGIFVSGERFRDEPEGIENEALLGVKMSVPLPVWKNGSSAVTERQLLAQRREELLAALQLRAAHEAQSTWQQMQARFAAARRLEKEVLPLAQKLLADTQATYERGEADTQSLFRARQHLITVENEALNARSAFHLARSAWVFATVAPSDQIRQP